MAILIGVIALAVIPNIQRSRESKDLTTLDNIMSALNVAAANARLSDGTYTITYDTSGNLTGSDDILPKFKESIGEGKQVLGSSAGKDHAIKGTVVVASGVATITVEADGAGNLSYTEKDDGSKDLKVTSTTGSSGATS